MSELDRERKPIVVVTWCAMDLMDQYGLTVEEAEHALDQMSRRLEEQSISFGWDFIDTNIERYVDKDKQWDTKN